MEALDPASAPLSESARATAEDGWFARLGSGEHGVLGYLLADLGLVEQVLLVDQTERAPVDHVVDPGVAQVGDIGGRYQVTVEVERLSCLRAVQADQAVGGRVVTEERDAEIDVVAGDHADRAVADPLLRVPGCEEVVGQLLGRGRPELSDDQSGQRDQHVADALLDRVAEIAPAVVELERQIGEVRAGVGVPSVVKLWMVTPR